MVKEYFSAYEVRPGFSKEYVCIFDGWLGKDNLHKSDEVTDSEWDRFNLLYQALFNKYSLFLVDLENGVSVKVDEVESIISTHKNSRNKESPEFTRLIIPELEAVYTEEWDYTSILWHKNNGAREAFLPLVKEAGLYQFNDDKVT